MQPEHPNTVTPASRCSSVATNSLEHRHAHTYLQREPGDKSSVSQVPTHHPKWRGRVVAVCVALRRRERGEETESKCGPPCVCASGTDAATVRVATPAVYQPGVTGPQPRDGGLRPVRQPLCAKRGTLQCGRATAPSPCCQTRDTCPCLSVRSSSPSPRTDSLLEVNTVGWVNWSTCTTWYSAWRIKQPRLYSGSVREGKGQRTTFQIVCNTKHAMAAYFPAVACALCMVNMRRCSIPQVCPTRTGAMRLIWHARYPTVRSTHSSASRSSTSG